MDSPGSLGRDSDDRIAALPVGVRSQGCNPQREWDRPARFLAGHEKSRACMKLLSVGLQSFLRRLQFIIDSNDV